MSSIAGSQGRTLLALLREMAPRVGHDRNLPAWIQTRLAKDKRFGSRDRRLYRELLYTAVRFWPWVEELETQGEAAVLSAVVSLAHPLPSLRGLKEGLGSERDCSSLPVVDKARLLGVVRPLLPPWVEQECPAAARSPNIDVLHSRAPLWLRVPPARQQAVLEVFQEPYYPESIDVI